MANGKWLLGGLMILSMAVVVPAGCKKAPDGRGKRSPIKASVSEFDPADASFDLDTYGSARVDEYEVSEAFNRTFDGLDGCVAETKKKLGLPLDQPLPGEVDFQVQLNPNSSTPMGVNAKLSASKWDKNQALKDCLRDAVAKAGYPTYDGPPQLAEFSTDLDVEMEDAEDDW